MPILDIHRLEPNSYNPSPTQILSWADTISPYQLPSGKVFVIGKGPGWTPSQVLGAGMTNIQHNDFSGVSQIEREQIQNAGKSYHSVPFTPELMNITDRGPDEWVGNFPDAYNKLFFPNGLPNYDGGFAYGQNCDISHRVTVAETMENTHYTNPRAAFWGGFYDAKTARLNDKWGPGNWLQSHDYLFINMGPSWHYITESQARAYFRNPNTLENSDYLTGTLKHCNLYCAGGYLSGPDRDNRYVFDLALKCRMYKMVNRKCCLYWDPEREWMPNMKSGQVGPEGILYKENKMPTPSTITAGLVATSLYFGVGFIGWNTMGKVTNKIWSSIYMEQLFNSSFYVKNGETQRRPWQEWPFLQPTTASTIVQWGAAPDIAAFTAKAYAETLGQVAGGVQKPARYKIDNGAWYTPQLTYEDDLCYAKYNNKPIVETQVESGKEGVFFIDPMADNKPHMITVEGQTGVQHTFEAQSNLPHMGIANI